MIGSSAGKIDYETPRCQRNACRAARIDETLDAGAGDASGKLKFS